MSDPEPKPAGPAPGWLFSALGLAIVFALLVTVNLIVKNTAPVKIDLTEDKLHTLSDGTRDILGGLDTPVTLSFFVSQDKDNMPPELTTFAKRVDALLGEYARNAKGDLLEIERVDPEPDSEAEDRAKLNNLRSVPGRLNEPAYIGLTATCLDRKSSIPLLLPNRDQMLEYDISRAIVEVTRESPPKIGLISALPVGGGPPAAPFGPQAQQQRPWHFYAALQRDYDPDPSDGESNLVDLGVDVEEIPEDIDVVLLVHPAGLGEAAEFALDQFLLRGGRIVAFLDAFSAVAADSQPRRQPFGGQQPPGIPTSSDLKTLLPAWGVTFEANQVIADRTFETAQTETRINPTVLSISAEGIDEDDALTSSMRDLLLYMAGVFYIEEKDGIDVSTLVRSSEKSQLVSPQTAQFNPDQITRDFDPSGKEYPLAIRLTGSFKTAFPDGKPGAGDDAAEDGEGDEAGDGESDGEAEKAEWLTESQSEGSVLLVADSDMLFDSLAVLRSMFGVQYRNHNVPLLEGAVEQAAGGADLIAIRSRGSTRRPFNKFKDLRAEASKELMKEIVKVDEKQRDLSSELSKLMQEQGSNQMVVVSPEVMEKINDLKEQEVEAAKRKRELNRELRKDIRKIENRIKNWNIIGIPVLIAILGIVHLVVRRMRTSAR